MRTLFVFIAIALANLISQAHAGPFDGKYRLNKSWDCKNVGADGGAIRIGKGLFETIENTCTMKNPTKIRGMSGILYDMECAGEGETYKERMLFIFQNNKLFILSDTVNSTWQICPPN